MFGPPPKKKTESRPTVPAKTKDEIPLIKPKQSKDESLKMPEVQAAMDAGQAMLQNKGIQSNIYNISLTVIQLYTLNII